MNGAVAALRFFFKITLGRPEVVRHLTLVRQPRRLPNVLAPDEVLRLLEAAPGPKYKAAFGLAYGAGLRVSEVASLKVSDIDSQRMLLRIEQGKGKKDRHGMLSPRLLELLREWWGSGAAAPVAVPRSRSAAADHDTPALPGRARYRRGGRDQEACVTAHPATQLRHAPAGAGCRHPCDPSPARTFQVGHDGALRARGQQGPARGAEPARSADAVGAQERHAAEVAGGVVARPALEVADIFRDHGPAWRRANQGHLSHAQMKVMSAIEGCRTAALGGHVARCENPAAGTPPSPTTAAATGTARSAKAARRESGWRRARPSCCRCPTSTSCSRCRRASAAIAFQNKAVIYDLLFKASSETLLTIAADPKRLGVRIGFTSVLHTWGSAMTHHPHVHMIVPGGGISLDGSRWISSSEDYLLPVPVLSAAVPRQDAGDAEGRARRLAICSSSARTPISPTGARSKRGSSRSTTRKWHVYAKRPFAGPEAVLAYLARYTHRVAISNSRLVSADETGVTFKYKDYRIEGPRPLQDHDAGAGRVHPPLHAARAAEGLPSHPALRAARQRPRQVRHHRAGTRADRCSGNGRASARPSKTQTQRRHHPHRSQPILARAAALAW